jgi:uncharacterized protein (DUF433 family)
MERVPADSPWFAFVSIDPERLGGEAVFRDSRVPIRVLFEYLESGRSVNQFLEDFEGITREQVSGVLRLAGTGIERGIHAA